MEVYICPYFNTKPQFRHPQFALSTHFLRLAQVFSKFHTQSVSFRQKDTLFPAVFSGKKALLHEKTQKGSIPPLHSVWRDVAFF